MTLTSTRKLPALAERKFRKKETRPAKESAQLNPSKILELGFAFWASKVLLTAVEMGVFTALGDKKMTGEQLGKALGLHERGIWDFLDTLVSMNLLQRDGDGKIGRYSNTPETAQFLDKNKPQYVGGILEMASQRLYKFWHDLPAALRTGQPQNEVKHSQ